MHDPNLDAQIKVAAYFLAKKNLSYDQLCWMLAEKQLALEKKETPAPHTHKITQT